MVRFNRSMNDVFNVEESSELLSASSNRHAAPYSALRSTLMMRSFLRVFEDLAVETRWPEEATDDFLVEFESIRDDQGKTLEIHPRPVRCLRCLLLVMCTYRFAKKKRLRSI